MLKCALHNRKGRLQATRAAQLSRRSLIIHAGALSLATTAKAGNYDHLICQKGETWVQIGFSMVQSFMDWRTSGMSKEAIPYYATRALLDAAMNYIVCVAEQYQERVDLQQAKTVHLSVADLIATSPEWDQWNRWREKVEYGDKLHPQLQRTGLCSLQSEMNVFGKQLLCLQNRYRISGGEDERMDIEKLVHRAQRRALQWEATVRALLSYSHQRNVPGCKGSLIGEENCQWISNGVSDFWNGFWEWAGLREIGGAELISRQSLESLPASTLEGLRKTVSRLGPQRAWKMLYEPQFNNAKKMADKWQVAIATP